MPTISLSDLTEKVKEGHSDGIKFPNQAQEETTAGEGMYHQPLPGYGVPPPYHHYPPAPTGSEPHLYYYPPPPQPSPGEYHSMPPGYSYGPPYYPIPPPPPPEYFYPPIGAPMSSVPKISPPSSAIKANYPNSDYKTSRSNKDPAIRNNIPSQTSSTSTDEEFLSKVKPMRSDFFIFASENKEKVLKTIEQNNEKGQFYIMTELNEKLLNMWENLHSSLRIPYQAKEEEDRIRFMHEDEIESRHCATLTSRSHSAKYKGIERNDTNNNWDSLDNDASHLKRSINTNKSDASTEKGDEGEENYESPPKRSK